MKEVAEEWPLSVWEFEFSFWWSVVWVVKDLFMWPLKHSGAWLTTLTLEENAVENAYVMLSLYPSPVIANKDIELKIEGTLCCFTGWMGSCCLSEDFSYSSSEPLSSMLSRKLRACAWIWSFWSSSWSSFSSSLNSLMGDFSLMYCALEKMEEVVCFS